MTEASGDLLSDLADQARRLLAAPPVTEKKLLELSLSWTGLPSDQAQMAEQLRLFVITWDPLERLALRPDGFATVNADPPGLELVVYVPVWSLFELAAAQGATASAVLAAMGGAAVVTAAAHEHSATSGRGTGAASPRAAPDLLLDRAAGAALGTPEIGLVSKQWKDIGLGAITDIVQHAFGRVDLDRSAVELAAAAASRWGCPACAGRRFGFPAELAEAQVAMCPDHDAEAAKVIRRRLARANASNPDGWAALADASGRLELPHLPNGLATKLAGAEQAMFVIPEPEELAARALLVVEAAGWFVGRRNEFAIALGADPEFDHLLPDWLMNFVVDLGRARLIAEAVMVGDALARVDPDLRDTVDSDIAVALAEAGQAEEARSRIEANLAPWPDDFSIRMRAGDALAVLGDLPGAAAQFTAALLMADDADDFEARSDAIERLEQLSPKERRPRPKGRQDGSRKQPRRKRRR